MRVSIHFRQGRHGRTRELVLDALDESAAVDQLIQGTPGWVDVLDAVALPEVATPAAPAEDEHWSEVAVEPSDYSLEAVA